MNDMTFRRTTRPPTMFLVIVCLAGAVISAGATTIVYRQGAKSTGLAAGTVIRAICANEPNDYAGAFYPSDDPSAARCMTAQGFKDLGIAPPPVTQ